MIERQVGAFSGICFAQDGAQIVTSSSDKTLRLWDVKTGKEHIVLEGHLDGVISIGATADGFKVRLTFAFL